MRCFVTGATGFVGSWLVRKLLQCGDTVAVLVRPTSDLRRLDDIRSDIRAGITFLQGDLPGMAALRDSIVTFAPEIVFHLAWAGANSAKYVDEPYQVFDNLPGSLELVRIAAEAGARGFLSHGSVAEYGPVRVPVREDDPAAPNTLYGASKRAFSIAAEALCARYGMRFCHLRQFWSYGPWDDAMRMIPYLVRSLLAGERPALTEGRQLWDYIYVEDVAEALHSLAASSEAQGVFNLGSGEAHPLRSLVEQIRDLIDPALPLGFGEVPYRPDQIMHLQADITRLRNATGWAPRIGLDEGLRRTVAWYRAQACQEQAPGTAMQNRH